MEDRRPTRRSIVASMGLEPRFVPEEPVSPPTWGLPPASPTRSRTRKDSSASRNTTGTVPRKAKPARASAAAVVDGAPPGRVRAAGPASSIKSKPSRQSVVPAAPAENGSAGGGGTLGRSFTSKLFGRGASAPPPEKKAVSPAAEATSYETANGDGGDPGNRGSMLFGLVGGNKSRVEPSPAAEGDSRRKRWNDRNKTESVITAGFTDMRLADAGDDMDVDDDETEAAGPLGLGRMSAKQARQKRASSHPLPAIAEPVRASPALERHQLVDEAPAAAPVKRKASRKASTKRNKNGAPQLPALSAIGIGTGLGSIIRSSKSVEPELAEEDETPMESDVEDAEAHAVVPARAPSRLVEDTEDDEDFQEADDSAFPVTPAVERQSFVSPEQPTDTAAAAEPADVPDEDDVAPVLHPEKHAATIGEPVDAEEDEEEVPAYDLDTARSAPAEKSSPSKKNGLLAGAGIGAGLGGGLAALAGGSRKSKTSNDKSPVVPGGFGHDEYDEVVEPPQTIDNLSDDDEDFDDTPAPRAAPVVAAVGPASKSSKKVKRKEPKKDKKEKEPSSRDAVVAAPALRQAPERPQRSKARKPSSSKREALAVPAEPARRTSYSSSQKSGDDKKKKRGGLMALAGGALGIGGASAAAKKAYDEDHEADPRDEPEYNEYLDEPAVLSDEDDEESEADSEEVYRERQRSAKTKSRSSKQRPAAAAAAKPTKRSGTVKNLTPVQRHYLLKALVCLQMQLEWEELEKLGALTLYGFPFSADRPKLTRVKTDLKNEFTTGDDIEEEADDPYDEADTDEARRLENLQEPLILRHLFQIHLRVFPGLDTAPLKFWQKRIQVFFDEMAARNFSTSVERGEYSKRRFYTLAMTRYLGGYFARGVGVRGQGELRGPGPGEKGSERWGVGKQWGKGTVKRGLDRPARIDSSLWKKIDNLFGEGPEGKVWRRAGKETTRVRGDWQAWKEQIIENETGLDETINFLDISQIRNLPPKYRNAEEWARNHAAYLFHSLFVTVLIRRSPCSALLPFHTLFPYWGAKQLLKYANAQVLIEGILNLLLARPAGAKSLIQRIAAYVIGSEATTLQKEYINPLKKAINDSELTGRIEEYVARGSRPEGRSVRAKAEKTGDDVLTVILLSAGGTPLRRQAQDQVVELQHSFARSPYRGTPELAYPADSAYAKENPDKMQVPKWDGSRTDEEEALKFARLKLYLRDCVKKRDREQAVKMASGALVPTIIKDFLSTVMYDVIKQIASTADLSARLGDLQNFVDDLIDLKKKKQDSLQDWIALCARHENSLYLLVHECASIAGRFWEWCQIGLDYMALSTTDPVHPADRSAKNIEVNLEELLQDSRLSEKDVELILEEVDELAVYTKWSKVAYELEMRKNFLLAKSDAATSSTLTEDDIPTAQMKDEIRDIDGLMRELMETEGVPVDDGTLPNESRGTEARELATFWFDVMDPLGQHLQAEKGASELTYKPLGVSPPIPCLKYTRKALPVWREVLREKLPDWQHGDANGPKKAAPPAASGSSRARKGQAAGGGAGPSNGEARSGSTKKSKSGGLFGGR